VDQGFGFSPAINITFRGAAPGESNYPMRNFFPFNHNTDSYALDRFDFARGPNAILFGAAQFGGTPISVTKQALATKAIRQAQLQFGSWRKYRATRRSRCAPPACGKIPRLTAITSGAKKRPFF
jgi:outer membrane receptor protein involved in Fe transport